MSINVSSDITTITVESAANTITVVDTANKVNVVTSQPITEVVKVVAAGPRGLPGEQGIQGAQGVQGIAGEGIQGIQGIAGSPGGAQGVQGTTGSEGAQGIQGIQGTTGIGTQGATGTQGTIGAQGTAGSEGSQGTTGTQGAIGETGAQGATGEGIQGIQGIAGETGIQGITGIQGAVGTQGIQGIQGVGIQGSTGAQGAAGSGTTVNTGSFATTGSNTFNGDQTIQGYVTASSFQGNGRYLKNLSATTNWNHSQEYTVEKTEQLTFSGDYILENTYLYIEGGIPNTIGEWDIRMGTHSGSIVQTSNNVFLIEGPNSTGNFSDGNLVTSYFTTETTMSVDYVWNTRDAGNEWATYDITTGINNYPYEISTENMLVDRNGNGESGTWTINIPANSYLTIGVWSSNSDELSSTLEITLPYLPNEDIVPYSANKSFKKEGTIYIGGNLLVKDSYIENDGKISVGGEVILIGNSQIDGTGIII